MQGTTTQRSTGGHDHAHVENAESGDSHRSSRDRRRCCRHRGCLCGIDELDGHHADHDRAEPEHVNAQPRHINAQPRDFKTALSQYGLEIGWRLEIGRRLVSGAGTELGRDRSMIGVAC